MANITKEEDIFVFKILTLGDTSSGKAQFISRFCEDRFDKDSYTTVGIEIKHKYVKIRDKKIDLRIIDTAGQEKFGGIAKNYFKSADGIILMYDITKLVSFKNIEDYINMIKNNTDITKLAIIIVGNKCDLSDKREVNEKMRKDFETHYNMKIYEASAKDNINVNECFIALIDKMIELGLGKKLIDDDNNDDDGDERKLKIERKKRNNNNCFGSKGKKK